MLTDSRAPVLTGSIILPFLPQKVPHCSSSSKVSKLHHLSATHSQNWKRVPVQTFPYTNKALKAHGVHFTFYHHLFASIPSQTFSLSCHHLSGCLHQHESPVTIHPQGKQRTAINKNLIMYLPHASPLNSSMIFPCPSDESILPQGPVACPAYTYCIHYLPVN